MVYTSSQLLSFEEFLAQYGNNPRYELADGELIDMEPTGPHETVAGKLASKLSVELECQGHSWFIFFVKVKGVERLLNQAFSLLVTSSGNYIYA